VLEQRHRLRAIRRRQHPVAKRGEFRFHQLADGFLIIRHQHQLTIPARQLLGIAVAATSIGADSLARGKNTSNVVP
jgi:hypothetical protein